MKDFNVNLESIYELPFLTQVFAISGCFVVLFILAYFISLGPLKEKITNDYQNEDTLKGQLAGILQEKLVIQAKVKELPQLKEKLTNWQAKILHANDYPALEKKLLQYGEDNQLNITSFTPDKVIKINGYNALPVKITLSTSYNRIGGFIGYLANLDKLIVIKDFSMVQDIDSTNSSAITFSSLSSNQPFKAEIDIEIYEQ